MDASATIIAQIGTAQDPRESEPSISRGGEGLKRAACRYDEMPRRPQSPLY